MFRKDFTISKILETVRTLKDKIALDLDGLPTEFCNSFNILLVEPLTNVANHISNTMEIPFSGDIPPV